jgi:hypothetical protein
VRAKAFKRRHHVRAAVTNVPRRSAAGRLLAAACTNNVAHTNTRLGVLGGALSAACFDGLTSTYDPPVRVQRHLPICPFTPEPVEDKGRSWPSYEQPCADDAQEDVAEAAWRADLAHGALRAPYSTHLYKGFVTRANTVEQGMQSAELPAWADVARPGSDLVRSMAQEKGNLRVGDLE